MGYQLEASRSPQTEVARQIQISKSVSTSQVQLMRIGRVLSAQVRHDPRSGKNGLLIAGKFFNAKLPASTKIGQNLKVEVVDASDAITLQILPETPTLDQVPSHFVPVYRDLQEKLDSFDLNQFRRGLMAEPSVHTQQLLAEQLVSDSESSNVLYENLKLLCREVPTGDALLSSADLYHILTKDSDRALRQRLQDIARSLSKEVHNKSPIWLLRCLESILSRIDIVIKQLADSTSEAKFDDAESSSSEQEEGPSQLPLEQTDEGASFVQALRQFSAALDNIEILETAPETSCQAQFQHLMHTLRKQLSTCIDSVDKDGAVKALQDTQTSLAEEYGTSPDLAHWLGCQYTLDLIEHLEGVLCAQDLLKTLNPLMHRLGQPTLQVVPLLLTDSLCTAELVVHTEQNATIRVPLKQRGDVRCKIASDAEEHLLEFTAETQETVQALQELRGTLEERLAALGLHQVKIKVSLGSVKHLSTDWLDSLRALQVTVD